MDLHVVFQNVTFILDISTNSKVQTKLKINFIIEISVKYYFSLKQTFNF